MEFVAAGYEIIEQKPGLDGLYEAIELPGRICYWSQDKITPGSAKPFVERLMQSNHGAPLEHGTVYLRTDDPYIGKKYKRNPYSKVVEDNITHCDHSYDTIYYITTNFRVLFENNSLDDLKYWCEPTQYHEKRYQVRFTIDRFTGEEFLRHRKGSFNRESTRYVCYTKEKFGGGSITYIIPVWMLDKDDDYKQRFKRARLIHQSLFEEKCGQIFNAYANEEELDYWEDFDYWLFALKSTEWAYCNLVTKCGWQAQQARTVLPCAIKSPLIMTMFASDWVHFFNLRALGTTGSPHPQAKELANPLMNEFIKRGYIQKDTLNFNKE